MEVLHRTSQQKAPQSNSQHCCRYHQQEVRSKGAILIIFWTAMASIFFKMNMNYTANHSITTAIIQFKVEGCPFLFFPIAGWIADTWFGRYRVIAGVYI